MTSPSTPKGNTRGNKNTLKVKAEEASIGIARTEVSERITLTNDSLKLKDDYNSLIVTLKSYNDAIKAFLTKNGQNLDLKEFIPFINTNGYQTSKLNLLTLESLKKIFPGGNISQEIVTTKSTLGGFSSSTEKTTKYTYLSEILNDIKNLDLQSFKKAIDSVNIDIYNYDYNWKRDGHRSAEDHAQRKMDLETLSNLVFSLKGMDLASIEKFFVEPLLIAQKSSTGMPMNEIMKMVTDIHTVYIQRDELVAKIYALSSDEVAKAIESGDIKCQNSDQDSSIKTANNKVIKQISGEEQGDSPQELTVYSDFMYHSMHVESQCTLQETLRVNKAEHNAQLVLLLAQVFRDCTEAKLQEQNTNYDAQMSQPSSSNTQVAIFTDKQTNCKRLEAEAKIFTQNVAHFFAYKTADDEKITKAMLTKTKPIIILNNDGDVTVGDTDILAKHSKDSSRLADFDGIHEQLEDKNPDLVTKAITGGKTTLDAEVSLYIGGSSDNASCSGECNTTALQNDDSTL